MSVESSVPRPRDSAPRGAVFLSYASQDAEAARRICEALRAAGVEVWFDQSELRGGDAWDQNIRKQIKECALFLPVISANTQARTEGYFRREWRMAVDRMHDMADDAAFLLPIVIDATPDATARVPERFRERQWTRLPNGGTSAPFCERVQRLLDRKEALSRDDGGFDAPHGSGVGQRTKQPSTSSRLLWLAGIAVTLATVAVGIWSATRFPTKSSDRAADSAAAGPIVRAVALMDKPDAVRADFDAATSLLEQVTKQDATNADAWAAWSELDAHYIDYWFDASVARRESARARAAQAIRLDAASIYAQFSQAIVMARLSTDPAVYAEAEKRLRPIVDQSSGNVRLHVRALQELAWMLALQGRVPESLPLFDRAARHPEYIGLTNFFRAVAQLSALRYEEALRTLEQSPGTEQVWNAQFLRANLLLNWNGNVAAAARVLTAVPQSTLFEDVGASVSFWVHLFGRDLDSALKALRAVPREFLESTICSGPKGYWVGEALDLAGRPEAARAEWQAALDLVDGRLANLPNDSDLLQWKVLLLARLGHRDEAAKLARLEYDLFGGSRSSSLRLEARIYFDRADDVLKDLESLLQEPPLYFTAATLRLDPMYDPLRTEPRFQALLSRMELDPRFSPDASRTAAPSTPPEGSLANPKSIAVLPFANLSPDPENAFFCDGMHDDVITVLAKIRDLRVISRTSTLAYRDPASRNLKKIATELGVANVLEGSVRRAGNKVRVSAQLIDARTDAHLWAETYDGDLTDIFALQAKLAQQIAGALQATLTGSELALIERRPTESREAYDLFLRARAMQQEQGELGTVADFERIVSVYDQAIARDPAFALAHTHVAQVHSILYWFGFLDPSPARAARMKVAVDAAARLAPDAPETHVALGSYYYRVSLDWNRALAEFRLAEAGLPNDARLRFWLAITHRRLGHWTDAADCFAQSVALDPRDLASASNSALYLSVLRRWETARAATEKALAYFPTSRELLQNKARVAFALDGDAAAYARAVETLPPSSFDPAGATDKFQAALLRGDLESARQALDGLGSGKMLESYGNVISDPVTFHQAYVAFLRSDHDGARRLAEQAIAHYRGERWNTRQQPWVQMRIAQLEAWAGRTEDALRDGQSALSVMMAQDAMGGAQLAEKFGTLLVSLDRREEALTCLRQIMTGPCTMSPSEFRVDQLWSRLKDDPRFEEILQSAKSL